MDPLSHILSLIKPRRVGAAGLDAGGDWSLRFPSYEGIKFNAVFAGECWLSMDELDAPLRIRAGDCFLLPKGRPFQLASDRSAAATNADEVFAAARGGNGTAVLNGGGAFFLIGSRFLLEGEHSGLLLGSLPPLVHMPAAERGDTLPWALERMRQEMREARPGSALVVHHLAQLMLVEVLRRYASGGAERAGWLQAFADRNIGAALALMHGDLARRWTLGDLAREVGMSRTSFALRFRDLVGLAPGEYLTRWRMLVASERLASSPSGIAAIAPSLGYESESAFGAAFKRVMGCSPRQYGRARQLAALPDSGIEADLVEPVAQDG